MNWDRPILTDSGGFQVFSLGFGIEHEVGKMVPLFGDNLVLGEGGKSVAIRTKFAKVEEEGPTFQSQSSPSMSAPAPCTIMTTQRLRWNGLIAGNLGPSRL